MRRVGGGMESSMAAPVWVSRVSRRAGVRSDRDAVLTAARAGRATLVEWDWLLVRKHFSLVGARWLRWSESSRQVSWAAE